MSVDQPTMSSTSQSPRANRKKVLAIASGGGHWVQLLRLRPALAGSDAIFATTRKSYESQVSNARFQVVPDCNRWNKLKLLRSAIEIFWLILKEKPDTILSTGAAPGYFAIRFGKLLGKKTIWVDSIANAEELSLSGQKVAKYVDHWITQWEHLASPKGPNYFGNVLGDTTETNIEPQKENCPDKTETAQKPKRQIFVTVGTDLPFDRLVEAIDQWAPDHPESEVFAQIGNTNYKPKNVSYSKFLEPEEFKNRLTSSDLILSHAGMGTILSSLQYNKPLLVMPRIASLGEHRNEHQLATAKYLKKLNKVSVANNESELLEMLENKDKLLTKAPIGPYASETLSKHLSMLIAK